MAFPLVTHIKSPLPKICITVETPLTTWVKFKTQEARVALGYRLVQLLRIFRALQTSRVHP